MKKRKYSKKTYPKLVNKVRGTILTACINLEIIMDLYISEQFADTNDKINELSSFIITPRISWSEKLEIFKLLIAKYNPVFGKKRSKFHTEIKAIIEHRNVFAHYPAHISQLSIDMYNEHEKMTFAKIKAFTLDGQTKEIGYGKVPVYTNKKIDEVILSCNLYIKEIKKLLRTFKKKKTHLHP